MQKFGAFSLSQKMSEQDLKRLKKNTETLQWYPKLSDKIVVYFVNERCPTIIIQDDGVNYITNAHDNAYFQDIFKSTRNGNIKQVLTETETIENKLIQNQWR